MAQEPVVATQHQVKMEGQEQELLTFDVASGLFLPANHGLAPDRYTILSIITHILYGVIRTTSYIVYLAVQAPLVPCKWYSQTDNAAKSVP